MAITNHERVGKAMDLLKQGLQPFIERELNDHYGKYWVTTVTNGWRNELSWADDDTPHLDVAALLRLMWEQWNDVFRKTFGHNERNWVSELRTARNKWAHQEPFSTNDAQRVLDSVTRLLAAVSAPEAEEVERMRMELMRVFFEEQVRSERRKSTGALVESSVTGALKPWREIVTPHRDVASGRYQKAEFAADLWQVHLGEGSDEYRNPVEFFRRTYLTESLRHLLVGAVRRLGDGGGDPVIQLQTNFGGGKTHSMLALYHLVSGIAPTQLAGIDSVMAAAGATSVPTARRVVLVGNKISPSNPSVKADGTVVRTLWGELAWQLGGRDAYERIRLDDEYATSPGDRLRELFNDYGPCLILIDEWVAYARQLHDRQMPAKDAAGQPNDQKLLSGGDFETQFSFAQALTESAKLARNCLLVVSLPASDTSGSPHTQADDAEVGGLRGREALDRLRNVIGRVESSWRPASAEEGFEIVRRRLFEPLTDPKQFKDRDVVARAFADLYRTQGQEFPAECRDSEYEKRLSAAYPIHPEIFDRLYTDWSTLVKFQRTRGVLRLMAAVIHDLWERGDRNPLIMPANIPIDQPLVQFELTRYLSDNWVPTLEKDVDGPNSLPLRIDSEITNLGKFAACRRVARTIYLGSAPTAGAANRGLEDRRIKLGCVMPGETPAVFGDALRRLASAATYLYQDGTRYWYNTQPTVTKLADDRAEQLKRDPDAVALELGKRLRANLQKTGEFKRVHPLPGTSADVPDDLDARLVVLGIDQPYSKEAGNPAETAARAILENRGNSPRLYRNVLAFLAADKARLQDLDEAARKYLAWESILGEKDSLDLTPHQVKQAEIQKQAADGVVTQRIPETYQWLILPQQTSPQAPVEWKASKLSGRDALAERAGKWMVDNDALVPKLGLKTLRLHLNSIPLWRGDHVAIRQLIEDFGRYHYLPRLKNAAVLIEAIRDGLGLQAWASDSFAYADSYDEAAGRYVGLRAGEPISIHESDPGLLVRPEVARRQLDAERPPVVTPDPAPPIGPGPGPIQPPVPPVGPGPVQPPTKAPLRRFFGSVTLDPNRAGRDASRIAEEIISHLTGLVGATVKVTLEIEVQIPDGAPEHVVRTVTENSRTLKFDQAGFEEI